MCTVPWPALAQCVGHETEKPYIKADLPFPESTIFFLPLILWSPVALGLVRFQRPFTSPLVLINLVH